MFQEVLFNVVESFCNSASRCGTFNSASQHAFLLISGCGKSKVVG